MTAPRILQVVLSLNPGGTERLVVELASRLHASMPMAVCCLDEPGAWADRLRERGIGVTALGRRPGFRPGVGRDVARAAALHGAAVVHAHHYSPFVYSALARLWQPSLRLVFTEHGRLSDAPPSPRRRLANHMLALAAHRAFAVSADLREHLVGEGWRAGQVGVIHNGIEVGSPPSAGDRARVRAALGVTDDTFVVGTVARLDPVKDLGVLVDAAGQLGTTRRVRLVIVGDGPEMLRLKQAAAACRTAEVTWLGHRDDARDWLAGFDVFVNSSTSEGVSLTILEAMAAERPVVATRVGGTPEVVTEDSGRLVPARDPKALCAALHDLAADPALRERLGRDARRRVDRHFTLTRMVQDYADVYASLAPS